MKDLSAIWNRLVSWLDDRTVKVKEEAPDAGTVKEYAQILKTLKDSKPSKGGERADSGATKQELGEILKEKGLI